MKANRWLVPLVVALSALTACSESTDATAAAPRSTSERPAAQVGQESLVVEAFNGYKTAALAADGEAAAQRLADTADSFYDDARESALTASDSELRRQSVAMQLTVLFMRGSIDAELLRSATPQELVVAAIDAGLVGEEGIRRLELGEITVSGDTATAKVLVQAKQAPFEMSFIRQDGRWTLDLVPLIELGNAAFEEAARQQGLSVDELVDATLVEKYGSETAAQLREPLGR